MEKILHLYKYVDGVNDSPFPSKEQQATLYEFKYDAKRMGNAPTITGTLMHPLCLDELWGNNEVYVSYNGERYFIKQTPTSSYSNDDTRYKHECDFVSERVLLNDVYFYDVVTSDVSNDKPVSNSSNVVFYGDIHELAKRLNYSLQYAKLEYSVVVDEGITSESKLVSFQKQFFANVLQEGYKLFEIPYYFEGKVIHFGYTNNTIDKLFSYGAKDALLSISKNNITQRIINRITGVGSADNIPYYYPNFDPKGVSEVLYNGKANNLVSVENLIKYKKVKLGDTFIYNYESDKVIEYVDKSKYVVSKDITLLSENHETTKRYELVLDFPFSVDIAPQSSIIELDYSKSFLTNFKARLYRNLELRDTFTSFGEIPYYRLIEGEYNFSISLEFTFGEFDEKTELTESDIPSIVDALTISITSDVSGFEQWTLNTANNIVKLNDYGLKLNTSPKNGDKITFKQLSYIPPQPDLMPPIYRETLGAERFYNALNNTYYDRIMGSYYSFDNLFMVGKNKEDDVLFEDIKPSIKGVTNSYYERIDVFSEFAWDENDNDEFDEEGNYLHPYFFGKLRLFDGEFGFNLFDHAIEEDEMVISMTSGSCGGCNFIIGVDDESQKNIVQVDENGNLKRDANGNVLYGSPQERQNDTSKYEVWVALKKDIETFGVIMPNATNNYRPSAGDTFVILHIDLPNAYILAAEERLREELIKYMKENNSEKFNFSLSFSRIFFAENPTILAQLNENARIKIAYNNNAYTLYVSSYSYSMNADTALPEIRVELSEELAIVKESIVKQLANASLYLNKEVQRVNTSVATTNTTISKNTATAQASITKTNARVENVEKVVMNLQSNSGGGGGQGGINEEQLENYLTTNQYAKKSDIPSLDAYAKSDDVANTYATKSALKGVSDSVNTLREDFDNLNDVLNGNVGGVIDTWNEVVSFLDGYSQGDDLAAILRGMKTDITNRVLIEDFEKLEEAVNPLFGYFDANGNANNALKLGGHSAEYFATATSVSDLSTDLGRLSGDLSTAQTNITTLKGYFTGGKANFAIKDKNGNDIVDTYATKTSVNTIAENLADVTGRVDVAEDTLKTYGESIAKNATDIAANAKAIGVNETAILNLDGRVDKLEGYWFIDDDGNLHTTYSIVVDKGGAFGMGAESGGDVGGLGKVTIYLEGSNIPYESDASGKIVLPAYPSLSDYATQAWVEGKKYLTSVPSEYITETELSNTLGGYQTKITSSNKLDYSLLKNTPSIPSEVTESTVSDWGFTKNTGTYSKPSGGIPKTDLEKNVQTSLGKADTALQSHQDISHLATKDEVSKKVDKVDGKQLSTEDFTTALKNKLNSLSNYDDTEVNKAIDGLQLQLDNLVSGDVKTAIESFNEIIAFLDGVEDTETLEGIIASIEQQIAKKQDIIDDLDTIRSGAAKGATALQSYTEIYRGTYSKPEMGIPKSDLEASVQESLNKADTALQEYVEQYRGTVTGIKVNGETLTAPFTGVIDLGDIVTEHQDISGLLPKTEASRLYQPIIGLNNLLPYYYLSGAPVLSTVATSGKYGDLVDAPTLSLVATSGLYEDLLNKPTSVSHFKNDAGYITSSALNGYAKTSDIPSLSGYATKTWVSNNYQPKGNYLTSVAWGDVSGKPSFATVATSGKYSDLSGTPSSLPASDVYDWAKAMSKPSYAFSEITGKPATLGGYGITDALSTSGGTINGALKIGTQGELWYGSNGEPYLKNTTTGNYINVGVSGLYWNNTNQFLTDANYYNYALPLSGGVLNLATFGEFIINSKDANVDRSAIIFKKDAELKAQIGWDNYTEWGTYMYNYPSDCVLGIKNGGTPHFNGYPLYHTGNFNPADYLPLSGGTISGDYNALKVKRNNNYGAFIQYENNQGVLGVLGIDTDGTPILFRGSQLNNADTILHSGNYTSYAIPSYDGVAAVYNPSMLNYSKVLGISNGTLYLGFSDVSTYNIEITGSNSVSLNTINVPKALNVVNNGNVLIGATEDDGHKLRVSGRIKGTGYHLDNTDAYYCGLMPYNMISSGGDSRGIWLYNTAGLHFYGSIIEFVNSVSISGNLTVTGGGAFGSDIRYKDITSYRQIDLETIANAPLFSFRWTDREDKVEHLGTSAQYWLDTQFKDAVNITNPKFFHLDYGALAVGIGISVAKEVKVVKTEVELLRDEVRQLRKKLKEYETYGTIRI